MTYYISVYIIYCFLSCFKIKKKKYIYFTYLVFGFIFGLRNEIGADWLPYKNIFERSADGILSYEMGFSILNYFVYKLTQNFNILVLIIFMFNLVLILNSYVYYSNYYKVCVVIWMSIGLLNFGILRQSLAISIFIYSIRFIKLKKMKLYFILVTIGAQFHASMYLLYFVYFLPSKVFNYKKVIYLIFIGILFSSTNLVYRIVSLFNQVPYISRIAMYIDGRRAVSHLDIRIVENIIILMFIYLFINKMIKKNEYIKIFVNMHIINILIQIYFSNFELLSLRYIKYFEVGTVVCLSEVLGVISKTKKVRYCYIILIFTYYLFRYIYIISKTSSIYLPYKNILETYLI